MACSNEELYLCNECRGLFMSVDELVQHQCIEYVENTEENRDVLNITTQSEENSEANLDCTKKTLEVATSKSWSKQMTKLLIATYKDFSERPSTNYTQKKHMWEAIAEEMQLLGYEVTGAMCDEKWRRLKRSYTAVKDKISKSGASGRIRFEYYNEFNEMFGKQPNFVDTFVYESQSTAPIRPDEAGNTESNSVGVEGTSNEKNSVETPIIVKPKYPPWYLDYIKRLEESDKRKEERHKERSELKRKQHDENIEIKKRCCNLLEQFINK